MEYEVRFYYNINELNNILNNLKKENELKEQPRTYEKTIQYNHSDERYNFYSQKIDGRFRVRISSNENETKCKLSWKRRLKNTTETEVNKEEYNKNHNIVTNKEETTQEKDLVEQLKELSFKELLVILLILIILLILSNNKKTKKLLKFLKKLK